MSEVLTKAAARNIFFGGTVFFFVVFLALVADSVGTVSKITDKHPITPSVAAGKRIWEKKACFDCHTLMGEGARYAPELKNVWQRFGGDTDAEGARANLKAWFAAQPSHDPARHQMPQFHFSDQELEQIIDFLKWNSEIDTQNWPPHIVG